MTVTAVDTRPSIEAILEKSLELNQHGLVPLASARLLLYGEIGPVSVAANPGEAIRLTVYFSRQDRVYAVPAFEI